MTGFSVVYGVSNNDRVPVDNAKASFLGFRAKDNAEQFATQILSETPNVDVNDPAPPAMVALSLRPSWGRVV